MFTIADRTQVRDHLLAHAETDDAIVGAAFTGSLAVGSEDRWSDTDLVLAVRGDLTTTLDRWTQWLYKELNAQHHWDLPAGASKIRVFLLPQWLEIDLTFAPEADFGPRGPQWQTLFGQEQPVDPFSPPDRNTLVGLLWHHALHARICIQRARWWQAEHWISAMRDHVITLASLRLGHPASYAKGAHLLPDELMASIEATLVKSISTSELNRALAATIAITTDELQRSVPELVTHIGPMLAELADETAETGQPAAPRPSHGQ
ncbi:MULTISPECIES: hypothetical protein [Streptomyces]|uniref:Nucleotidyltransferase domain-containing protein n=1 Tax=Streptomyces dengpaensis TaxID=2049881 RepID=A0ABN5HUR4_9ACTN|nr:MULTISPECIES: hypothetical protein [Streptomyces]AVH54828.1 hypothetical protein C4B68_02325 [Streptomyces dengpaensis]PIA98590.1 hypothetical protein B1C81_39245 [Streptomyces sp. HG99]